MKKFYDDYLENDHKFDKITMLQILALVVVIAGILVGFMSLFFIFLMVE